MPRRINANQFKLLPTGQRGVLMPLSEKKFRAILDIPDEKDYIYDCHVDFTETEPNLNVTFSKGFTIRATIIAFFTQIVNSGTDIKKFTVVRRNKSNNKALVTFEIFVNEAFDIEFINGGYFDYTEKSIRIIAV